MRARTKDFLDGWLKVRLLRQEYVGDKCLRVAIDHWKPGALHLDHDAVSFFESMIVGGKRDLVMINCVGRERFRLFEALQITSTKNVARNHELVSAHALVGLVLVWINVDEFDDPVAVSARRGGEKVGDDSSGYRDVLCERFA